MSACARPPLGVPPSGGQPPLPETWFDTPERLAALEREARRWLGTPFFPNSNTPGPRGGVSCQKLVAEIYRGVGFCDVPVPEVPMAHARFSTRSLMEEFLVRRPEMVRVAWVVSSQAAGTALPLEAATMQPFNAATLLPGDLLGFRIYRTIHHMGIVLPQAMFVHALDGMGTIISSLMDATWSSRLAAVWRPNPSLK